MDLHAWVELQYEFILFNGALAADKDILISFAETVDSKYFLIHGDALGGIGSTEAYITIIPSPFLPENNTKQSLPLNYTYQRCGAVRPFNPNLSWLPYKDGGLLFLNTGDSILCLRFCNGKGSIQQSSINIQTTMKEPSCFDYQSDEECSRFPIVGHKRKRKDANKNHWVPAQQYFPLNSHVDKSLKFDVEEFLLSIVHNLFHRSEVLQYEFDCVEVVHNTLELLLMLTVVINDKKQDAQTIQNSKYIKNRNTNSYTFHTTILFTIHILTGVVTTVEITDPIQCAYDIDAKSLHQVSLSIRSRAVKERWFPKSKSSQAEVYTNQALLKGKGSMNYILHPSWPVALCK